jgi:dTDP-4-dehydrorhamnose reductase
MILVFGKNGQIAKELQMFKNVIALSRSDANFSNPEICVRAIHNYRPSVVINAAAYTAVDQAEAEEDYATQINGFTPGIIANVCADLEIPFIHISSDYVFDGSGNMPWKTISPTNPQNAYGRGKLIGEKEIIASGSIYAILRTSWVVSSYGENFIKSMLRLSETQNKLNIVDDQIGGPTPAKDIANVCIKLAKQLLANPNNSGIYHYSGEPDTSWCKFANEIFKISHKSTIAYPILTAEYPAAAMRPLNSRLNCQKIYKVFNIKRPDWRKGIKRILKDLENK